MSENERPHGVPAPWERPWARVARPEVPPASDGRRVDEGTSVAAVLRRVGASTTPRRRRRAVDEEEESTSPLAEETPPVAADAPPAAADYALPVAGDAPAPPPLDMPDVSPAPVRSARPTRLQVKRARRRHRATALRRSAAAAVALLVFLVTGAAWGATKYLDAKVNHVDALDPNSASVQNPGGQRGDENYLLVGSDSRAGANGQMGAGTTEQAAGARSDTVMLAHVPADRGRVVVVSFPRDLEVDRPACAEWNNADAAYSTKVAAPETQSKLNAAYAVGGPKCLVQVIQQLSGLKINHFVGVDFAGFESLVNQIGGVEVCTTRPLVDHELGTILPRAGTQLINGQTALSYVRARKVDAEGTGDYGRIKRQQRFLSSLLRKAMSTDVLLNFGKLTGFINGFTAATFGQNMDSNSLITLGQSLQGLSAGRVTFITVPTTGTRYGNEVPDLAGIATIFRAIIDDTPLPGEQGQPGAKSTPAPSTTAPTKPGGSARIDVLNATSKPGLAGATSGKLADLGYTMGSVGTEPATQTSTTIRYSTPQVEAAKQLASSVSGARLQETDGLGDTVELVLGQSFAGAVQPPTTTPAALPPDLSVINAGDTSCG